MFYACSTVFFLFLCIISGVGEGIGTITSVKMKRLFLHICTLGSRNWNAIGYFVKT